MPHTTQDTISSHIRTMPNNPTRNISQKMWMILPLFFAVIPFFFIPLNGLSLDMGKGVLLMGAIIALIAVSARSLLANSYVATKSYTILALYLLPVAYFFSALSHGLPSSMISVSGADLWSVASVALLSACAILLSSTDISADVARSSILFFAKASAIVGFVSLVVVLSLQSVYTFIFGATALTAVGSWHDVALAMALSIFILVLQRSFFKNADASVLSQSIHRIALLCGLATLFILSFLDIWLFLGLTCLVALFVHLYFRTSPRDAARTWYVEIVSAHKELILVLLLCVGMYFGGTFIHDHMPAAIRVTITDVRPSWGGTTGIIRSVYKNGAMLLGSGPQSFVRDWNAYKPIEVNTTTMWQAQFVQGVGVIPTAFAETGLFGGLVWILLVLLYVYYCFKTLRKNIGLSASDVMTIILPPLIVLVSLVIMTPSWPIVIFGFASMGVALSYGRRSGVLATQAVTMTPRSANTVVWLAACILVIAMGLLSTFVSLRAMLSAYLINRAGLVLQVSPPDFEKGKALINQSLAVKNTAYGHRDVAQVDTLALEALLSDPQLNDKQDSSIEKIKSLVTDATAHIAAAIKLDKNDAQTWLVAAQMYSDLAKVGASGAYDSAKQSYGMVHTLLPNDPSPMVAFAQLAAKTNNEKDARDALLIATKLKQDYQPAYILLGDIETAKKNLLPALQDYGSALSINQSDPTLWYRIGSILYASGDLAKARQALEAAVSLNPNYSDALFALANIYSRSGDTQKAADAIDSVKKLNPAIADKLNALLAQSLLQPIGSSALDQQVPSNTAISSGSVTASTTSVTSPTSSTPTIKINATGTVPIKH